MSRARADGGCTRSSARGGSLALLVAAVTAVGLVVACPAHRAASQTPVAPEDVSAIAESLNCPLCQGYNLQDCPLEVCAQMRAGIAESLASGMTRDEIVAGFVADYGPQVLNEPPRSGFAIAAWVVPPIALFLAMIGMLRAMRAAPRGARSAPPVSTTGPLRDAELAEYAQRLECLAGEDDGAV